LITTVKTHTGDLDWPQPKAESCRNWFRIKSTPSWQQVLLHIGVVTPVKSQICWIFISPVASLHPTWV
jgi:hypothetical protein